MTKNILYKSISNCLIIIITIQYTLLQYGYSVIPLTISYVTYNTVTHNEMYFLPLFPH